MSDVKVGDLVIGGDGKPWRVVCEHRGILGLVPYSWWERLKWWFRLRFPFN